MRKPWGKQVWLILALGLIVPGLLSSACQPVPQGRPTLTASPILSETPLPSRTPTPTLLPSSTPTLTATFTPYASQHASATPTFTATAIPPYPARLFPLNSGQQLVDWSYSRITQEERREDGSLRELAGCISLRLLDRGIHRQTIKMMGKDLSIYYLRVSHTFAGEELELKLILTGFFGHDIAISQLPADGSLYLSLYRAEKTSSLNLASLYQAWALPPAKRSNRFQNLNLRDFELILADLPETVILLAGHPVAWSGDDLPKLQANMAKFSAYAARFSPFFRMDSFGNILGASAQASAWQEYLLHGTLPPLHLRNSEFAFSADYLILVTP
jgi:hypothetical protein